ncbi:hypothetical protein G9A89_005197 [Geosiphon pyriformis]|nr:hypothetical protein G9A89_005197 [Geosiphon pyriformis]
MGTTVHNLGTLLDKAVVGFESKVDLDFVFSTESVFGNVRLSWARLNLIWYRRYGRFGHSALKCDASGVAVHVPSVSLKRNAPGIDHLQLAKLYAKKNVPISRPTVFVSLAPFSGSSPFGSGYGLGLSSSSTLGLGSGALSFPCDRSPLAVCLASLEYSLELLADQVSGILRKLSFVELVPMVLSSDAPSLVGSVPVASVLDLNMALDGVLVFSSSPSLSVELSAGFNSSSSKVLTTKIGGLESKMSAMKTLVSSVLFFFTFFIPMSGLVWKFTTCNVCEINVSVKQKDVMRWHRNFGNLVLFITETKLNFIGAGVAIIMDNFLACHVSKMEKISGRVVSVQLLFKGKLLVTLLRLYASASSGARFGQTSEVNSFIAKAINSSTHVVLGGDFNKNGSGRSVSFKFCFSLGLSNSRGIVKTIDYIFVSDSLSLAVVGHQTISVSDFFNIDHRAVMISIGLGGLLDNLSSAKLLLLGNVFSGAEAHSNVNVMWVMLQETVLGSADEMFSRHWFNKVRCLKNKHSSKFFGLELLVAKIVKKFCSGGLSDVDLLVNKWLTLDNAKACAFRNLVSLGVKSDVIVKHLLLVHKDYRRAKMFESKFAEKTFIRKAIDRCMENFCSDKGSIIRSVLNRPFHKVVLNYLVVDDDLVLKPNEVKVNDVFSGVMCEVDMGKLLFVVSGLSDGKTAGFSEMVLGCMLTLFNVCLTAGVVPGLWKKAWVSMIPKLYDWDGILSDHILVACSKFDVLWGNNFLVLKSMSTQFSVFAIGSVVENALEKNQEVWLVLQDMQKAYDSVGWHHLKASLWHIKMCEKFIRFFGGIYKDRVNRVMTDFDLFGGYKVKRHEQLCGYWIDTKFVSKTGRIKGSGGLTSYFSAGTFVDDIIWFFIINDISINSEKTVAIPINQSVKIAKLSICGQPILIAKKGEAYYYLGIFLSTEELSKLSVVKAHADVHFFVNVVLRKTIMDKQFLYLVLAVLQPIVSYYIQFSFGLRSKACLPHDFSDAALYHPLLYGLKPFEQMQSEGKVTALIMFSNAAGVLGHLFSHRFLDLQVLGWVPLDSLQFSIRLHISPVNNFLAGLVKIFLDNRLSLVNNLSTAFCSPDRFSMSAILRKSLYFNSVISLRHFGVAFEWFDELEDVSPLEEIESFAVSFEFLRGKSFLSSDSTDSAVLLGLDILRSNEFSAVRNGLHDVWLGFFEVFMDGSLKNFGSTEVASGAAAYFPALDLSVGVAI